MRERHAFSRESYTSAVGVDEQSWCRREGREAEREGVREGEKEEAEEREREREREEGRGEGRSPNRDPPRLNLTSTFDPPRFLHTVFVYYMCVCVRPHANACGVFVCKACGVCVCEYVIRRALILHELLTHRAPNA